MINDHGAIIPAEGSTGSPVTCCVRWVNQEQATREHSLNSGSVNASQCTVLFRSMELSVNNRSFVANSLKP